MFGDFLYLVHGIKAGTTTLVIYIFKPCDRTIIPVTAFNLLSNNAAPYILTLIPKL